MNKTKKSPVNVVLDIVIVLLCLALVGAVAFAIDIYMESFGWSYDADSFYYRLSDGDYGAMVDMYYSNESNNVKPDEELGMYYAVAEYFEAASWYKAYGEAGDSRWGEVYRQAMDEAQAQMGSLNMLAEDIRIALEIE